MKKYNIKLNVHLNEWCLLPFIFTGNYKVTNYKVNNWKFSFLCFSLCKTIRTKK